MFSFLAEPAEDIEHMQIECRREIGTGKNYQHERQNFFHSTWTGSYYAMAVEFERKETHSLENEVSGTLVNKIYEAMLRRYRSRPESDITYEGITADGAVWQFKLLNGDESMGWRPINTIKENGSIWGIF